MNRSLKNFYFTRREPLKKDMKSKTYFLITEVNQTSLFNLPYSQPFFVGDPEEPTKPSPACFSYTTFLVKTALSDVPEVAVAAFLPCFYIYMVVGRFIEHENSKSGKKDNMYSKWYDFNVRFPFSVLLLSIFPRILFFSSGCL